MRPKGSSAFINSNVARLLNDAINDSNLSQAYIAREIGYNRPNMVTMIKQGRSRLPFKKLEKIAILVNLDPKHLLDVAIKEYEPDLHYLLEKYKKI